MLAWAMTFLAVALIAAALGYGGAAGASAGIAQMLFVVFLVLFGSPSSCAPCGAARRNRKGSKPQRGRCGAAAPLLSCGPDRPGKPLLASPCVVARGFRLFPGAEILDASLSALLQAQEAFGRSTRKGAGSVRQQIRAESPRRRAPGHRSGSGQIRQADWQRPRPAGFPCFSG